MSAIDGTEALLDALNRVGTQIRGGLDEVLRQEFERAQQEAADLVPVDTGQGRDVVLLPEAIRNRKDSETGMSLWEFGFLTSRMRKQKNRGGALHLFWVEFGTKRHVRGDANGGSRRARRGTLGKGRKVRRRKRGSPPRPAQPWFRPAVANLLNRIAEARSIEAMIKTLSPGSDTR